MENVFSIITTTYQSLWNFRDYGSTLEIITPVATINDMFVSVLITNRDNDSIATDGGWIHSGFYDCDVNLKMHILKRIYAFYFDKLNIQKVEMKSRVFYFKRINKLELLPNIVFDMANFINAIVSTSNVNFNADREEITFKKHVRGFMMKQFGEERFEYDKPLNDNMAIRFNAIERSNTGINLFNFISGSNSTYYANSLCRSNTQFQMIKPLHEKYSVKKTVTLLDDQKKSIIESPQVQTIYNYLLDNQTPDNPVILWSQKNDLINVI